MIFRQNKTRNMGMPIIIAAITLALFAFQTTSAKAAEQVKIGYLDLDRVVSAAARQTPEYDELSAEWEKKKAEIERRREEIDQLTEELKANRVIWSESKSREQEKLIRDKADDLKVFRESAERFRDVEQNKILRGLLPEIADTVKKIGEREGYSMIFEKRVLLYGSPNFNLTDLIIKEISESNSQ
jgi:outer membrane protein